MKMKINRLEEMAVALGLVMLVIPSAHAAVVFQDQILNYTVGASYTNANSQVFTSESQGPAAHPPYTVQTNSYAWSTAPGNQLVDMSVPWSSGWYHAMAVSNNATDPYGQIYVRVGKNPRVNSWLRLFMSTNSVPQTGSTPGNVDAFVPGAGADVLWDPNGTLRYRNAAGLQFPGTVYPTNRLHTLTINYNLNAQTYSFWLDTNLVVGSASLETAGFGSTVRSIALGATMWSNPGVGEGVVLDEWYWKTDAATPFTSYGFFVPEPGLGGLMLLGGSLVWWRLRKR